MIRIGLSFTLMQTGMDRVVGDILCGGCGESLKSLSLRDPCKKCGKLVSESIGDTIAHWGSRQMTRLNDATRWMAWTAVGLLAGFCIYSLVKWPFDRLVGEMFAVAIAFHVWAAWKWTAIPPGKAGGREQWIRAGGVVFLLAAAVQFVGGLHLMFYININWLWFFEAEPLLFAIAGLGLFVFQMQIGGRLADLCEAAGMSANGIRSLGKFCWIGILGTDVGLWVLSLNEMFGTEFDLSLMKAAFAILTVCCAILAVIGYAGLIVFWFRFVTRVDELRILAISIESAAPPDQAAQK